MLVWNIIQIDVITMIIIWSEHRTSTNNLYFSELYLFRERKKKTFLKRDIENRRTFFVLFFPRKDFSLGIFLWGFHSNHSIQSFCFLLIYSLTKHISVYFLLNYWFRMMWLVLVCFKNWVFNLHFFWFCFW